MPDSRDPGEDTPFMTYIMFALLLTVVGWSSAKVLMWVSERFTW